MAAKLVNYEDCPNLFACSVYDTKPVHMLSTTEESMYWVVKKRKVWSAVHSEIQEMGFLHLNFIDNYNNNIADQLWNQYQPNHWMHNRKWRWSFFIWGIGVASVNAYKIQNVRQYVRYGEGGMSKGTEMKWSKGGDAKEVDTPRVHDKVGV
jgi:hypothetical protein